VYAVELDQVQRGGPGDIDSGAFLEGEWVCPGEDEGAEVGVAGGGRDSGVVFVGVLGEGMEDEGGSYEE